MAERKTLKSVSIDDVTPRITLTPIVEVSGETCRIHHIKSDSIAIDGCDTFVPLRHVSKQKRRIFELEAENAELRELVRDLYEAAWYEYPSAFEATYAKRLKELGIEVDVWMS